MAIKAELPQQDLYTALSAAFAQYSEALEMAPYDLESARRKLQLLEDQWAALSLCGPDAINHLRRLRGLIAWECMMPETFGKFYRFVFHLCKPPHRKHIQTEVALEAWRLLLTHRFRLLDKWCGFMATQKTAMKVINEDQWRQVLDFSRCIHEDLSNYDANGAWACFLDDFVDHVRAASQMRSASRSLSMCEPDAIDAGGLLLGAPSTCGDEASVHDGVVLGQPVSPRCGSKRRSPDVDTVVERLSAIPLPSSSSESLDPARSQHFASPGGLGDASGMLMGLGLGGADEGGRGLASATKRQCTDNQRHPLTGPASHLGGGVSLGGVSGVHGGPGCQGLEAAVVGIVMGMQGPGMEVLSTPLGGGAGMSTSPGGGMYTQPNQQPLPPFACDLPSSQTHGRRHLKSRRSNVSELVNLTVSGSLFVND